MRCAAFLLASFAALTPARAELSTEQARRLLAGAPLTQETAFERDGQSFVGGVSYLLVGRDAVALSAMLRDTERYREFMPNLESATVLSREDSGVVHVRFRHRFGLFSGSYVLRLWFENEGTIAHMAVDRSFADNDLHDGWGFLRLTPVGDGSRTLLTCAVVFDLGPGLLRALFESRIVRIVLRIPERFRAAVTAPGTGAKR